MKSRTVRAERSLRADLIRAARRVLGPAATEEDVRRLGEEWYEGPSPEPLPETDVERRRRERESAKARADIERYLLQYGDEEFWQ